MKRTVLQELNQLREEVQQLRDANKQQWTELQQTLVELRLDSARRLDELTEKYNNVVIQLIRTKKNGDDK